MQPKGKTGCAGVALNLINKLYGIERELKDARAEQRSQPIRHWLQYVGLRAGQPLLPSRRGLPMTRSNVAERIALAVTVATKKCPQLQ